MKKNTFKGFFVTLGLLASVSTFAQEKQKANADANEKIELTLENQRYLEEYGAVRCYTEENELALKQKFPNRATTQEFEKSLAPIIAKIKADRAAGRAQMAVYNIPVVVHVLHNGEAIGTAPNITDAQVISQIDVFNEDFRRMVGTPGGANSTGVAVDVELNFCLAQQDEAGNPTNGINRVNVGQDGYSSTGAVDAAKPGTQWDPTKYMNMWSVKFVGGASTLLGYAQFPDPAATGVTGIGAGDVGPVGAANTDGVVAAYHTFGTIDKDDGSFLLNAPYDRGRTMTHEVGHYLGLRHIWGDGGCGVDDFCADTPESDASNGGCPTTHVSCGTTDQVQNYMDYTNDTCMDTFTQDQKDRMQAIMAGSPRRMELNSSIGCQPPTAVTFTLAAAPASQTNCGSDSVTYTVDMTALNGFNETTTFSATGNPAGSAVSFMPTTLNSTASTTMTVSGLTGATDGNYTITITGTSASETKNVNVALTVGTGVCPVSPTSPYATSITQVQFNTINNTSSLTDADGGTGYTDFTAQTTDVNIDSSYNLTVNVNTDGNYRVQTKVWIDWNQNCQFDLPQEEYDLGEAADVANGATAASPMSITVPSGAALGNTIMRVTAMYTAPSPIAYPTACADNPDAETEDYTINVQPSLSVAENQFDNFSLTPNPASDLVELVVSTNEKVKVSLFDIRGRRVLENTYENNSSIFNRQINLGDLSSGVYIITVESGAKRATQKLVIE